MTNAENWLLAKSTGIGQTDKEMFDAYARAGIRADEVSCGVLPDQPIDWKKIRRYADDAGVLLWSVHLPFCPFAEINPASPDPALRKKTVAILREYIAASSEAGIDKAVIHPSGEPNPDAERADRLAFAAETLAILADIGAEYGMTLCVEDIPRTCLGNCSADFGRLLADSDRLRVCFDTNHLLIEKNVDFIRALGDKIVTLHVSDYDFRNERHWLPFEGKNDWAAIVTALEEADYHGVWLYELGLEAPGSIVRPGPLTYEDFAENYAACVGKRVGLVRGTPNEKVCADNSFFAVPKIN